MKFLFVILSIVIGAQAMSTQMVSDIDEEDGRLIIPILLANADLSSIFSSIGLSGILGLNLSEIMTLAVISGALALPLIGGLLICGLIAAFFLSKDGFFLDRSDLPYDDYARALGIDDINWEKMSILDWIAITEETFSKFDATDMDCQKRLICEVHQNVKDFGHLAEKIVNVFSYIRYAEVFQLPEVIKGLLDEYQQAADSGRNLKKDCGEMYNCQFSVKSISERYSDNKI